MRVGEQIQRRHLPDGDPQSLTTAALLAFVRAFEQGTEKAAMWENAATVADGLRVPRAIGDFLILRAIRESGGTALAVPDAEIPRLRMVMAEGWHLLVPLIIIIVGLFWLNQSPEMAAIWSSEMARTRRSSPNRQRASGSSRKR